MSGPDGARPIKVSAIRDWYRLVPSGRLSLLVSDQASILASIECRHAAFALQ